MWREAMKKMKKRKAWDPSEVNMEMFDVLEEDGVTVLCELLNNFNR